MSYAKQMQEKRDEAMRKMEELLGGAKTENRAMTEEEQSSFDALEREIHDMDKSIAGTLCGQKDGIGRGYAGGSRKESL